MIKNSLFLKLIFAIALSISAANVVAAQNSKWASGFTGTWDSEIDFYGVIYRALYSFHAGGTLTESDNPAFDPNFGGDALSPGLGAWENQGRNHIKARYRKLAYSTEGSLSLTYTSSLDLYLTGKDRWEGTLSIVIALPDGTIVSELNNLPMSATRLTVD